MDFFLKFLKISFAKEKILPMIQWRTFLFLIISISTFSFFFFFPKLAFSLAPPDVSTLPASNVEERTLRLNGRLVSDGGEPSKVRFNWGDTITYGNNTSWLLNQTSGSFFASNLSDLTPGKTYHFRAHATNTAGSDYGADQTFITKPYSPSDFNIAVISSAQINLCWSKGWGAYYTMVRRKVGSYPTSVTDGTQAYYGTGSCFSDTGLLPETTYYYRAWSRAYEEGLYAYSDNYTEAFATTFAAGTAPISLPDVCTHWASNIGKHSAQLTGWLKSDGRKSTDVRFNWGDVIVNESNTSWLPNRTSGSYFSSDLSGLNPGKTYHFRAEARNSLGSNYGAEKKFITKPYPPSNFKAIAVSPTQINLSWIKGWGAYYTMVRRKTGSYPTSVYDGTRAYYGTGISFSDTGLLPETTYYYRAWSRAYEEGLYAYSDEYDQDFATTPVVNEPPTAAISCEIVNCDGPGCQCTDANWVTYNGDRVIYTINNDSTDPDNNIVKSTWSIIVYADPWYSCSDNPATPENEALCNMTIPKMPAGAYIVKLKVEDVKGLSDTASHSIIVRQDVIADFKCSLNNEIWQDCEFLKPSVGEVVYFLDQSSPSEGANAIVRREWIFEDGDPTQDIDNNPNPSTRFQSMGPKDVTLTVTDNTPGGGRTDSKTHTISTTLPLPEWKEIAPFIRAPLEILHRLVFGVSTSFRQLVAALGI